MIPEFENPSFINDSDVDTIHERMLQELPADIDNMPGGFIWDFTRPTALEKSLLIQFNLVNTLKLMFPMWAWDEWLDYHAGIAGLSRREARHATGRLLIKGEEDTQIPAGSLFATPAIDNKPSIEFKTTETYTIGAEGQIEIDIIAVEPGTDSNVAANTITLMSRPLNGVTQVCNKEPVTGGTEEEDDETLRVRVQEKNESLETSFTGCDSDYIRWAKEITGVGGANVIPLWNGPGTVKLVLTDSNGEPANEQILEEVYEYIISPDDRLERLAPIGAELTVVSPEVLNITYEFKAQLATGFTAAVVEENFRTALLSYYETAKNEGVLKFTKICSILAETEGIFDFKDVQINGMDHSNIYLGTDHYPRTYEVIIHEE